MKKSLFSALIVAVLLSSNARALDLTPHRILDGGDGPARIRYYFEDHGKRLAFRIDPQMSVTGSAEAALFRFNDHSTAAMRLVKSTVPRGFAFDPAGLKSYETAARAMLPGGATQVVLTETLPNAIAINGWQSAQFSYTYQFFGASYRRSVTFINLNDEEQIIFDVSAREPSFPNIYGRSYHVLNSLFELPLDSKAGPS